MNNQTIENMKGNMIKLVKKARRGVLGAMPACLLLGAAILSPQVAQAQLSSNPDKFLGNITTGNNQVDYGKEAFHTLWNQITPENATKWDACEGSRGNYTFGGADQSANYAKKWGFPFKFHTLVWGSQFPGWMKSLTVAERNKAIVAWFDAVKKHYPDLEIIDVVNEAVEGHQADTPYIKDALGGGGKTGYDWIIKAFEMAHERWPNAILIYNDFNTFQWNTDQYIDLVRTIRDAGAPVDAYGCQSHDLTDCSVTNFKSAMVKIQNALKMPMYSTEYDIGTEDDQLQLQRYKEQIPYMWEADYCAGITLWGYIYGKTWVPDGNSGIIKDGKDRPAMTWLRQYMQSEKAQTAKSPFPGMKKEASVYIKPNTLTPSKGEPFTITVNAHLRTKTIDHIDLYVKGVKYATLTEAASVNEKTLDAAYEVEYTPATTGKYSLKAVVFDTEGNQYERQGSFTAYNPRSPFNGAIELPGTVEAENFDKGGEGLTYHDTNSNAEGNGSSYRSDVGGVDIKKVTGVGYTIGYTQPGEWLEYTLNVTEAGYYTYDAYVSSGTTGSSFLLEVETDGVTQQLSETIEVPQTGMGTWDNYVPVHGRTLVSLAEGKHILRINVTGASGDIDKIVFNHIEQNNTLRLTVKSLPTTGTAGEEATLRATVSGTANSVQSVNFYVGGQYVGTATQSPYEVAYTPKAKGSYNVTAEATDADGKLSKAFKYTFKVNAKRTPYGTAPVSLPGTIQAERFDKGGEGLTFHDSDSKAEGDGSSYRSDAEGVDIVKGNNGYALGYTAANEWTEYSVNVKEPGKYTYEATVSAGYAGSGFRISRIVNGVTTVLANVSVPQTGDNSWDTYKTVTGDLLRNLEEGEQIIRITITNAGCNIDKIKFNCVLNTDIDQIADDPQPAQGDGIIYNLLGQPVDASYRGIAIKNGKKFLMR